MFNISWLSRLTRLHHVQVFFFLSKETETIVHTLNSLRTVFSISLDMPCIIIGLILWDQEELKLDFRLKAGLPQAKHITHSNK